MATRLRSYTAISRLVTKTKALDNLQEPQGKTMTRHAYVTRIGTVVVVMVFQEEGGWVGMEHVLLFYFLFF
jgi:hypothetical protein